MAMVVDPLLAISRFEHTIVWLPAIVFGVGLIAGVGVLLGRAFMDSVREWGHPRLLIAGGVALFGIVIVLTWLGISLPRE
jgi:hypothetical protein